jgi:type II secretory ATPase GspE/PulE/Tfp pilus assembly ATPase PilB-like protein
MLPADAVERVIWLGGFWLLLVVAWAAICMWVEEDAREVFGRSMPWSLGFVMIGALLFLATYLWGFALLPLFALVIPASLQGYVLLRDRKVPADRKILSQQFVERATLAIAEKLGLQSQVASWFERTLPTKQAAPRIQFMKKDGSGIDGQGGRNLDKETSQAVKTLEDVFARAIDLAATDIHLDPKESGELQVRCRVDGVMGNLASFVGPDARGMVSALKVFGDMDIAERRRPQDGTFAVVVGSRRFDIRAATGPTSFGEKMVLRLLDADGGIVKGGIKSLGMREAVQNSLESIIHQPHGMLIVSGPTGSGKTTTLYTALGEIDTLSRNIVTIEDPIEYRLDNISQTAVNNAADLTFAKILRSVLRQDPDVILVGEVRDRETAEIAMRAAMTGHFVFTTIHANDTATTVTRLLDLGIDSSLIQSAVTAVLAQRLVRVLCKECKEPYALPDDMRKKLHIPADKKVVVFKPKGCPACHGTGYKGRTGIHELLIFDAAIRELVVGNPSIEAIRAAARKAGMKTLHEAGLTKVFAGVTSFEEVMRVAK